MDNYAIIALGGKQYVVKEGEKILVDRLDREEGKTFQPDVLFVGGDGDGELAPTTNVSAKVLGHERGPKVRIGKYKPKSGYRRHTGFRSALTRIEITGIGGKAKTETSAKKSEASRAPAPAPAPAKQPEPEAPKGLPKDYADMTVAQVSEGAKSWNRPMLEAAQIYEQQHAQRKGALSALESALKAKDENDGA
jgi:large subunit ribosomal protein L21